jgi:hypothetical protein
MEFKKQRIRHLPSHAQKETAQYKGSNERSIKVPRSTNAAIGERVGVDRYAA